VFCSAATAKQAAQHVSATQTGPVMDCIRDGITAAPVSPHVAVSGTISEGHKIVYDSICLRHGVAVSDTASSTEARCNTVESLCGRPQKSRVSDRSVRAVAVLRQNLSAEVTGRADVGNEIRPGRTASAGCLLLTLQSACESKA